MFPHFEERPSDSPFVERIWMTQSERAVSFTSISTIFWSMVISKYNGKTTIFVPHISPSSLIDGNIFLPGTSGRSFSLCHSVWQFPNYENADTFVDQLVRSGILVHDPVMRAIHQGKSPSLSLRTIQYRFLRSTGLSQRTIRQIERARYAATLLKQGVSIFDTVYEAGYSDQPHLTRSLKHFIGHTPAEIPTTPIIALHRAE
jgi:hypothetical protein